MTITIYPITVTVIEAHIGKNVLGFLLLNVRHRGKSSRSLFEICYTSDGQLTMDLFFRTFYLRYAVL